MSASSSPKFPLGQIVATPNALATISNPEIIAALSRHTKGDWGDLDDYDREANDCAVHDDLRLFSVYHDSNGVKFWIITEWDRSVTTILLPEDY